MSFFYKYILHAAFFSFPLVLVAQDEETTTAQQSTTEEEAPPSPKQYYLLSPRVSVTVPHPMSNSAFKKCFVGIYEVSGGLNLYLHKGIFLGVTAKKGLLKITENKIADYNASMSINNIAGKLGGDLYIGDRNRVIYSVAVSAGKNWTKYTGLVAKDPNTKIALTQYNCSYVEPEMNIFFLIESNFGIGATVSYSIFSKNFDPYELSLNDWTAFGKDNTGTTQYLSFGFGFYYSLINKKKKKPAY